MKSPFAILGNGAPIFKALFAGMKYPVKNRKDLLDKLGGKERIIVVTAPDGQDIAYSVVDLFDAFDELPKLFPMKSASDIAKKFAVLEAKRRKKRKTSPLLKVKGKQMAALHKKRPPFVYEPTMMPIALPKDAATGSILLRALKDRKTKSLISSASGEISIVLLELIRHLIEFIEAQEAKAAAAAAARAEQHANAAEAAANEATQATQSVGSSATNEQAQQAVDLACAKATQATQEATEAANAAAEACAHASSAPGSTSAQTSCSRARMAASRAQAAASRAQGACSRARDIASIGIVTICGHVTEEDPCCDDNWSGAYIEVCNVNYPEIPCQTDTTDGNGNYCVTGRFGHSSRIGCSRVRVYMNAGANAGNVSQTKEVTVCNSAPASVSFSFDAPGNE